MKTSKGNARCNLFSILFSIIFEWCYHLTALVYFVFFRIINNPGSREALETRMLTIPKQYSLTAVYRVYKKIDNFETALNFVNPLIS